MGTNLLCDIKYIQLIYRQYASAKEKFFFFVINQISRLVFICQRFLTSSFQHHLITSNLENDGKYPIPFHNKEIANKVLV